MKPANKLLVLIALMLLAACGASSREKILRGTFASTNAAKTAFLKYDAYAIKKIVEEASSYDAGLVSLEAYREKQQRVLGLFELVYRSIAAAALVNDQPSLTALIEAAAILQVELAKLTGGSP